MLVCRSYRREFRRARSSKGAQSSGRQSFGLRFGCDERDERDEAMQTRCPGILVSDDCWVLSQPGQSCADICEGASRVDAETTVGGAFTNIVVAALEAKYGLHDTSRDRLDAPCGWPPYLAEGEVQFPEWGMVSLPVPTAHGTRHAFTHLRSTHG